MIRYGDLQLLANHEDYLIIACDSSGGIGNKEKDVVKLTPELAGFYAAFVPLVEVLATKGEVVSIVDTLCVEMEPTGKRIISGIKDALITIGLDSDILTGSTEDNMTTVSTGIGVTVIGSIAKSDIRNKKVTSNSDLLLIGLPKVGQEFLEEEIMGNMGETLTLELMTLFSQEDMILDMIPVGSKGVEYEANVLANRHELKVLANEKQDINWYKSAGPSTCLLVAINQLNTKSFEDKYKQIPIKQIAILK